MEPDAIAQEEPALGRDCAGIAFTQRCKVRCLAEIEAHIVFHGF